MVKLENKINKKKIPLVRTRLKLEKGVWCNDTDNVICLSCPRQYYLPLGKLMYEPAGREHIVEWNLEGRGFMPIKQTQTKKRKG